MTIFQACAASVAVLGVFFTIWVLNRLYDARHLKYSVFTDTRYSSSDQKKVRTAVQDEGKLPADPALRGAAINWAREETMHNGATGFWMTWQTVGFAMVACAGYLSPLPGAGWVVASVQVVIVLLGLSTVLYGRRAAQRAGMLLLEIASQEG